MRIRTGHVIANSEVLRNVHNSFANASPFAFVNDPTRSDKDKEDAYHYITYLPHNGGLYELDGLKRSQIYHGPCSQDQTWIHEAVKVIQKRIASYPQASVSLQR